jgi:hypothetical protein
MLSFTNNVLGSMIYLNKQKYCNITEIINQIKGEEHETGITSEI